MRRIILGEDTTLDGVVEGPEKWRFGFMSNDLQAYDVQKVNGLGAMLMGRVTYQGFAAFWPSQERNEFGIADKLNSAPKFVVSTTLENAEWNNTTILRENVEEEILKLKKSQGGDIGITGSVTLAQWLMQRNLVDEYDLLTFPLVLGRGRRLFKEGVGVSLELIDTKVFSRGVVLHRYRPSQGTAGDAVPSSESDAK